MTTADRIREWTEAARLDGKDVLLVQRADIEAILTENDRLREALTATYNMLRRYPSADLPDGIKDAEKWLGNVLAANPADWLAKHDEQMERQAFNATLDFVLRGSRQPAEGADADDAAVEEVRRKVRADWLASPDAEQRVLTGIRAAGPHEDERTRLAAILAALREP